MKIQVLFSFLPILARLTVALPAADPLPVPAISTTSFSNVTAATPTPLPDDDNDVLLEDESAESEFDPNNPEWLPASEGLSKRGIPTQLHWASHPNIKFNVGNNINADVDITLHSDGNVRFYTKMNNRRHWGPYKYAVACGVKDKAGRAFTLDRKGKVCRVAKSCHTETKDETVVNKNVKKYWDDITKGDRIMICRAEASWNLGKVTNLVLKWFKDNKEGVLAVIAIITAIVAAAS